MTKNIFIIAGGDGISTSFNTVENKIPCNKLINLLDNKNDMLLIKKLKKSEENSYSVWGYSGNKNINIGDFIFITHINSAVYMGTVYGIFKSKKFNNEYWANSPEWENKIILNDVIKIFIPDPLHQDKKEFFILLKRHGLENNTENFNKIESLYNTNYGLKDIISKEPKIYNFQGVQVSGLEFEKVMKNLEVYCKKCNFECIVKVV
ncbi:hypothetical protein [Haemophilus haemolyticus]|uniref:hypothetical protein n=1 Tax=Haemophilus haemolyticus TaxID=726 RepID=UPI001066E5CA|nr:hypothetical protein [Haemophilus haemolyticus]